MRCLECSQSMVTWSLLVAMEQREHFAMVRHAEVCAPCATRIYSVLEGIGSKSRFWVQTMDCSFCGHKLPIARLRFEVKDRIHKFIAICERCYQQIGPDIATAGPNTITFIEKEWLTLRGLNRRTPLTTGSAVKVISRASKYHGKVGHTRSFRCLAHPWYGYDVGFPDGTHHFFHERDLQPVLLDTAPSPKHAGHTTSNPAA